MTLRKSSILLLFCLGGPLWLPGQDPGVAPPTPEAPALADVARAHRDAIVSSSRVDTSHADLEFRAVFFPDTLRWRLLSEYLQGVEKKEGAKEIEERLALARKKWKKTSGRPGFEITLTPTGPRALKREEPRTMHFFPGDPAKLIVAQLGKKKITWDPMEAPQGLSRGRVRVALYSTVKGGQSIPYIRELEPKGPRLISDGRNGSMLGALPKALAKKGGQTLSLRLTNFDRFRGPSPEPNLIDLNANESVFERGLEVELERPWPPPWPPFPAALAELFGEKSAEQTSEKSAAPSTTSK